MCERIEKLPDETPRFLDRYTTAALNDSGRRASRSDSR